MIVLMNSRSSPADVDAVVRRLRQSGADHSVIELSGRRMIEVFDGGTPFEADRIADLPSVERVLAKGRPMLAADRAEGDRTLEVPLGTHARIGGRELAVVAGPCSVESMRQLLDTAHCIKEAGAVALRGGAFKPRTSPYAFQGLGEKGLEMMALAAEECGLAVVTEVMSLEQIPLVSKYADVLQVGSRNMHNSPLLVAVGQQSKPVLLKRGWSATFDEFLLAAEYVMLGGNRNVILCERGIRTHERFVRNTLALAVVPEVKRVSRLPIIADPSHGTGRRHLVGPMSKAAVACGADGLLIEVHIDPDRAWCDGDQTIGVDEFAVLMRELRELTAVVRPTYAF